MYHLHLHCSPSSPLPTHLPLKCCLWLRSERSGKRTLHTPHRWWHHETSAAFLCAEGLRLGENRESRWPARSGGESLRLRRRSRGDGSGGWRGLAREQPGVFHSSHGHLWVPWKQYPRHWDTLRRNGTLAYLSFVPSFQEKGGELFFSVHSCEANTTLHGVLLWLYPDPHLPSPVRARSLCDGSSYPLDFASTHLSPPGLLLVVLALCLVLFWISTRSIPCMKDSCFI